MGSSQFLKFFNTHSKIFYYCGMILFSVSLILFFTNSYPNNTGKLSVIIFFSVPMLILFVINFMIRNKDLVENEKDEVGVIGKELPGLYTFMNTLSVLIISLGFISFIFSKFRVEFAIICLIASVYFSILSIFISKYILIKNPDNHFRSNLIKELQHNKFYNIIFFFSIFLIITYLLTLSIALYDKEVNESSLYYSVPLFSNKNSHANDTSFNVTQTIKFVSHSSRINYHFYKDNCEDDIDKSNFLQCTNGKNIEKIINTVLLRDKKNNNARIRIIISGYANEKPLTFNFDKMTSYSSNYELAEARAVNTQLIISNLLYDSLNTSNNKSNADNWLNIEWVIISRTNEDSIDTTAEVKIISILNHYSQSELNTFNQSNNFALLDYLYFMIYSITTTGYGDIVPIDSFSKSIVSLANLIEVLFLVLFFNALMAGSQINNNKNTEYKLTEHKQ